MIKKFSKNKKIILLIIGLGILTTSIVTPIVVINNKKVNQEKENEKDVEKVIKILEEKIDQQRIIILPSDSSGNIIANNKNKIVAKLEELIGNSNLKNVFIEVLMNQDQKISTSEQEIIVKVSKGKHSKKVTSSKAYFVKRNQTAQEIIAKIKDKDILIPPNVSTQNQSEIQDVIKNQLKKENQTLNEDDLSKITINNIDPLTLGSQIKVTLIIKVRNTTKELKINVEKINLLKNSNVKDGLGGTIFKDFFGNLWTMGKGTPLQVLKVNDSKNGYVNQGWTKDISQGLLKSSNIDDGENGVIFQDSFKNLWAMGKGTSLQVLKVNDSKNGYVNQGWTKDISQGLLKSSNIDDGENGVIFQDSFKNLWAMGNGTKLQVLKINSDGNDYVNAWFNDENAEGLLKGSNITNGQHGTIFQDSFGNLWTKGILTKLQVLKVNDSKNGYKNEGWTHDNTQGLLNNSNIDINIGIIDGTIFQDSFKNLWVMAHARNLQVLKAKSDGTGYVNTWVNDENAEGLLKDSNITNGLEGKIFQDSFGNLWAMGNGTKLQVLKINSDGNGYENAWVNDENAEGLLKDSNITNGENGMIFQDSFKNLWVMGHNVNKLQVLKVNSNGDGYVNAWVNDDNTEELLNGSNIHDGYCGKIFQDSFKNLWIISRHRTLQVLIANSDNTGYINSWLNEENKK